MNTQVKLIKTKVGLLNLAEQLGNVGKSAQTDHLISFKVDQGVSL